MYILYDLMNLYIIFDHWDRLTSQKETYFSSLFALWSCTIFWMVGTVIFLATFNNLIWPRTPFFRKYLSTVLKTLLFSDSKLRKYSSNLYNKVENWQFGSFKYVGGEKGGQVFNNNLTYSAHSREYMKYFMLSRKKLN